MYVTLAMTNGNCLKKKMVFCFIHIIIGCSKEEKTRNHNGEYFNLKAKSLPLPLASGALALLVPKLLALKYKMFIHILPT